MRCSMRRCSPDIRAIRGPAALLAPFAGICSRAPAQPPIPAHLARSRASGNARAEFFRGLVVARRGDTATLEIRRAGSPRSSRSRDFMPWRPGWRRWRRWTDCAASAGGSRGDAENLAEAFRFLLRLAPTDITPCGSGGQAARTASRPEEPGCLKTDTDCGRRSGCRRGAGRTGARAPGRTDVMAFGRRDGERGRRRAAAKLPDGGLRRYLEPCARPGDASGRAGAARRRCRDHGVGPAARRGPRGGVRARGRDGSPSKAPGRCWCGRTPRRRRREWARARSCGITDDRIAEELRRCREVVDLLFDAMVDRVLLARSGPIEIDFLGAMCRPCAATVRRSWPSTPSSCRGG